MKKEGGVMLRVYVFLSMDLNNYFSKKKNIFIDVQVNKYQYI
jgi:hypothetical protein